MKIKTKYCCDNCDTELEWFTETQESDYITEVIFKDSPTSYIPLNISEMIEGDEVDVITYNYEKVLSKYKCPKCNVVYDSIH